MAARRLIAILIALMVLSTLAAALAPVREVGEEEGTATEPTTERPQQRPRGGLVEATVSAEAERVVPVTAALGDQLALTVRVAEPREVRIDRLGLRQFATPGAPARFDLIVDVAGTSPVTSGAETVARIEVAEASGSDDRHRRTSPPPRRGGPDGSARD